MSKLTKTNFKTFIKKNADNLFIRNASRFDGMTDGLESCSNEWRKAEPTEKHIDHTFGVDESAWLVGGGRDWFSAHEDSDFIGIQVSNCCGSFTVGIRKQVSA